MQLPMHKAKRCQARSKRTGKPCRAPAVRGYAVCRMHGARGGAPKGNDNALKHGQYTGEAVGQRRELRAILRTARKTLADLED